MSDSDIGKILEAIGGLKSDFRHVQEDVKEIKADVKRQNGRVTSMETNCAMVQSRKRGAWALVIGLGTVAGIVGSIVTIIAKVQGWF